MAPSPSPAACTDELAFVAELRRLKTWSARSFRELERHAGAAGDTLPSSTTASMLSRNRLPREALLATFVRACGAGEDAVAQWVAVRTAIADRGHGGTSDRSSSIELHPRLTARTRAIVGAAIVLAFAGGAAVTAGLSQNSTVEEEVTVGDTRVQLDRHLD